MPEDKPLTKEEQEQLNEKFLSFINNDFSYPAKKLQDWVDEIKKFQDNGADINQETKRPYDPEYRSTLLIESFNHRFSINLAKIEALLICGIDVKAKNNKGQDAFAFVCEKLAEAENNDTWNKNELKQGVKLLASYGADIEETDKNDRKYIDYIYDVTIRQEIIQAVKDYQEKQRKEQEKEKQEKKEKEKQEKEAQEKENSITLTVDNSNSMRSVLDDLVAPERTGDSYEVNEKIAARDVDLAVRNDIIRNNGGR